jgi:hypothetical protein
MPQIRHGWAPADRPDRPQPVFVDRTGRRRRLTVFAGVGIGAGLLVSLALLIVGLFTGSSMPLPTWPDPGGQRHGDGAADLQKSARPEPTPTAAPVHRPPTATTSPKRNASDRPGRGDEHRATPNGKTKSPGKPG